MRLSWATTINKFQGFEAGPSDNDPIKYVIADIGSKDDELNRPGLGYVASSRGKSLILDANSSIELSSVFFMGSNISIQRIVTSKYKSNGDLCLNVKKGICGLIFYKSKNRKRSQDSTKNL